MNVDIEKLKNLNKLVSLSFREKHIMVLNPENEEKMGQAIENDVIYDKIDWKITKELSEYVDKLSKDDKLSIEDKILLIFEKICKIYVYDDNIISYIKKIDDDVFSLPDWYGRDIDREWEQNRKGHNRRGCFELSRYLAKALTQLLENNSDYNVCIHWNKNLTHYYVGLTCSEYSITLDPDNFFNIKDLTRLKTGLTAEGVAILSDKDNKFKKVLKRFNEGRSEYAIERMEEEVKASEVPTSETSQDIIFLEKALEVLTKKYEMDSQGIFEYMKEIVDIRLGASEREKIWKKIEGKTKESTRYIRCLIVNVNQKKFLIDVDQKILRSFDEEELKKKRTQFVAYNDLSRGDFDYYDGT